jgi:hypothetical protein
MLDQNIIIDIEKDLLLEIIKRVDEQKMTEEQAQQLAKDFLALLPIQDKKDLLDKLSKFSQANNEAAGTYLKYAAPYAEEERLRKLELMSKHIQNGEIENALAVAKGGTNSA